MEHRRIGVCLLGVFVLSMGCRGVKSLDDTAEPETGSAGLPGCEGMEQSWEALVATIEEEMQNSGVPGAALAVICDGRVAYAGAWGSEGGSDPQAVTPSTRFQLASMTKMFTAAAALGLAEDGTVDLEAPVDTYVSEASMRGPEGEPVTLHQLLSHTAGYPTMFSDADYSSMGLAGFFERNSDQPFWSTPGAVFNYSNLGMSLAGLVLEQASGEAFSELVKARVFEPAGMSGASLNAAEVEEEDQFARGHSGSTAGFTEIMPTDSYLPTGYYGPMGGAWGSVLDLAAWGEAHLSSGGSILDPSSMSALATPWTETRRTPEQFYGYGLYIDRMYGFDLLNHGGSVAGYLGHWVLVPDLDFGVFSLVNCDWYYPGKFSHTALDLFVGLEPLDFSGYFSSESDWPAYEGRYFDPNGLGWIEVRREGNELVADFEDLGFESVLMGSYEDAYSFEYQPTGTSLTGVFWRAESGGDAEYLVTSYGVAARQQEEDTR